MVVVKQFWGRWHDDDKYRKSLSDIGWTEEHIIQYDEISLENHSHVAARQERSRNEQCWTISLNKEGIQGPMNQRSDFMEAKQKRKRLYDEHTEITGEGDKPSPLAQLVRQRLDQQFEGLKEYDHRFEPRTGWQFYPSSRPTHSSGSEYQSCGPVIPFGAMVENHPISAEDLSRLHQFGPEVLSGIFLGCVLSAGRIWKGDVLVADIGGLEPMHASALHGKRLNAKEVLTPMRGDKFIFPIADGWNSQTFWRRSGSENIHLNPG